MVSIGMHGAHGGISFQHYCLQIFSVVLKGGESIHSSGEMDPFDI